MSPLRLLAVVLAVGLGGMALAQPATQGPTPRGQRYGLGPLMPPLPASDGQGQALDGLAVAQGTVGLGALACHSCHGLEGNADGSGAFPRLAGQPGWYLLKQLQDYAAGRRPNEAMAMVARQLTDRQMRDVSAWYSAQTPSAGGIAEEAQVRQRQLGGAIAAVGVPERGVTACTSCHGRLGEGVAPSVPSLAGQFAPYAALQLQLWKRGERRNDPLGVMAQIARGMSDEEIDAVAAYFSALDPNQTGRPFRAER